MVSRRAFKIGDGTLDYESREAVFAKRYHGFQNDTSSLAGKAATGLWYVRIAGNPHSIEGEGRTPQAAIQDSISRTKDKIEQMQRALQTLQDSLTADWPID